jgi:hypothetical protein
MGGNWYSRDKSVCTDKTVIVHGLVLLYPVMLPPRLTAYSRRWGVRILNSVHG